MTQNQYTYSFLSSSVLSYDVDIISESRQKKGMCSNPHNYCVLWHSFSLIDN